MAKTNEELLQESIDVNKQILGKLGQTSASSGASAAAPSGSSVNWLGGFASAGGAAVGSLTKFTQGTYSATDALGDFSKISGVIGGSVGRVVGQLGEDVGRAGIGINNSLKTVSQSGVYLGNNLGLYDKAVLQARMSLPEFENTIRSSSKSISGMDANMDKSALTYLSISKRLQETDLAYQLQATGMQSEEFGKIITLVAHNSRQNNLSTAESQKQVVASAMALAVEMDNTARLTGISRQEQQEALDRQLKAKDMQLSMMALDDKERAAVEQNLASTAKYGAAVQDAVKIYATGGVTTAQRQQTIASMPPEMQNAVQRLSEIKGTGPEDDKRKALILAEMDQIAQRTALDKDRNRQMAVLYEGGNAQTKAMAETTLEMNRYGQILNRAEEAAKKEGISVEAYKKREIEKLGETRVGAARGTGGPEGESAVLSQTINKTERLFKDIAAGTGTYFADLNKTVGGTIQKFDGLNRVLANRPAEEYAKMPAKVIEATKEVTGVKEASIPAKELPKRQDGSLGAVGKLMEDWGKGTTVELHGKEGVVTEKQFDGLFGSLGKQMGSSMPDPKQMQNMFGNLGNQLGNTIPDSKQIQNMLGNVTGSLKTDLEKAKSSMPTTETFEKMFNQIKMPDMGELTRSISGSMPAAPANTGSDAITDVAKGVNELNMRIERLITAVTDGSDKSIRAMKSRGNLVA